MGRYTSYTPSQVKDIIGEIETLIYENRNISDGEIIRYNGIEYEGGSGLTSLRQQLDHWQKTLDNSEELYGDKKPANKSWFNRAEGMI